MPHGFLAAFTSQGSGHYDKAVEEGLKAIALDPDYAIGYENVAFAYIYLNRLSEAEALLRKAVGTQDRSHRILAMPVLYRISEGRSGGNGKGSDPTSGEIGSPGIVRAPGSSHPGVSGRA